MAPLGRENSLARREPIHREIVVRVGEAAPRLPRHRRFSGVGVTVPGYVHDRIDFLLQRLKGWIGEAAAIAFLEFLTRQLHRRHSLSDVDGSHSQSPLLSSENWSRQVGT